MPAESVTLDGSGSTDSDGTIVSYLWEEASSQIGTGVSPTLTFAVGVHTVTLTVTDDRSGTHSDDVVITVTAPVIPISFAADVLPYFLSSGDGDCVGCHGGTRGVSLDTWANWMLGGDNGPLVVPGNSADGSAILVPQMEGGHMGAPHGTNIIQLVKDWIDEGALDN